MCVISDIYFFILTTTHCSYFCNVCVWLIKQSHRFAFGSKCGQFQSYLLLRLKLSAVVYLLYVQNLYDMLLKLLEERGIDGDFVDQLTNFSTSYEHSKYVDVLEQLHDFVATK